MPAAAAVLSAMASEARQGPGGSGGLEAAVAAAAVSTLPNVDLEQMARDEGFQLRKSLLGIAEACDKSRREGKPFPRIAFQDAAQVRAPL